MVPHESAPAKTPGAAKPAAPKKAATGSGSTTKVQACTGEGGRRKRRGTCRRYHLLVLLLGITTHADNKKCHGVCFHPQASSSGKEAAVKNPGEASTIILDYLTSTNRPYGKCSAKS